MELSPDITRKLQKLNESTDPSAVISLGYQQIIEFRNLVVQTIYTDHRCVNFSNYTNIKQILEELE